MLRLISVLVVVGIMAVLWLTIMKSSMPGIDCDGKGSRTTTTLPMAVPKGIEKVINGC